MQNILQASHDGAGSFRDIEQTDVVLMNNALVIMIYMYQTDRIKLFKCIL